MISARQSLASFLKANLFKKFLMGLYLIGMVCILVLVGRLLIGGNRIINPQAMLPMSYLESSSLLLAIGAFPMAMVSVLLVKTMTHPKKLLLLVPSMIPVTCFVIWFALIGFEFLK